MRLPVLFALLALGLTLTGAQAQAPDVPPHVAVRGSTLRLEMADGLCSGTAIASNVILTASHCFGGKGPGTKATKPSHLQANGVMVKVDGFIEDDRDHVLLVVSGYRFTTVARLGKAQQVGDEVFMYGNGDGYRGLFRHGYYIGDNEGVRMYDLNVWMGDSGSAVFDASGRVVGVVSKMTYPFHLMSGWPLAFTRAQMRQAGLA